jgi:hypothetical protein
MQLKEIENRTKTIVSLLSELNKQFPKNLLINKLDEEINFLMDDLSEQPDFFNNNQKVSNETKIEIATKAKLHVLSEVKKDLEFQIKNRCSLENQKTTVEQSIKYVDRKVNYYKNNLLDKH